MNHSVDHSLGQFLSLGQWTVERRQILNNDCSSSSNYAGGGRRAVKMRWQSEWALHARWLFIFIGINQKYFKVWVWENTGSFWWHCWTLEEDCKPPCGYANVMHHPDGTIQQTVGDVVLTLRRVLGCGLWSSHAQSWEIRPWEYKSMQGKQKTRD